MRFFSEDDECVNGECETCGRVLKIKHCALVAVSSGFKLSRPVKCPCGAIHSHIARSVLTESAGSVSCPKCGSDQIHADKKGFGAGKAALGWVAVGPVGLLAGTIGSKNIRLTCLSCGNQFKPGERRKQIPKSAQMSKDDAILLGLIAVAILIAYLYIKIKSPY